MHQVRHLPRRVPLRVRPCELKEGNTMINLTINNRKIQAKPGSSILDAAQAAGRRSPPCATSRKCFPAAPAACAWWRSKASRTSPRPARSLPRKAWRSRHEARGSSRREEPSSSCSWPATPSTASPARRTATASCNPWPPSMGSTGCPSRERPGTTTRTSHPRQSSGSPTSASSAAGACASAKRSRAWPPSTSRAGDSTPWSCRPSRRTFPRRRA